jgi:hypothetical protein
MTDRSRGCIILVNASTNASEERAIGAYKADQADSKAACVQSYSPQSGYECVDGEKLVEMYIIRSLSQGHIENETNQGIHSGSKCAKLIHDRLCCAIWPSYDNTIVNPQGIDDASNGKHSFESENGPLACRLKWKWIK